MKKTIISFLILFLFILNSLKAQDSCFTPSPFCSGNYYNYTMAAGIIAPSGPDYGCLATQSSPLWISIFVTSPGDLTITGAGLDASDNPLDIDYIYWGPFSSMSGICYSQLDAGHILGCDYSTDNLLNFAITGATTGSYYIAMVSNYSGQPAFVSYSQSGGSGVATCVLPCSFNFLSATPSVCNVTDNTYSISGVMNFSNPPTTGTLTVFGSCGGSQTFTPPFTNPTNYLFSGLPSDSNTCFVSAIFSDGAGCSLNQSYLAPAMCNPNLSVKEGFDQMDITVAPNPSNGIVELSFITSSQDISVFITDILGRSIYFDQVEKNTGTYKKQIDLTPFDTGIYFVKVVAGKSCSSKKIIYN